MNHQAVGDVWLALARHGVEGAEHGPIVPAMLTCRHDGGSLATSLPLDVYAPLSQSTLQAFHTETLEEGSSIKQVHKHVHDRFNHFCRAEPRLLGGCHLSIDMWGDVPRPCEDP